MAISGSTFRPLGPPLRMIIPSGAMDNIFRHLPPPRRNVRPRIIWRKVRASPAVNSSAERMLTSSDCSGSIVDRSMLSKPIVPRFKVGAAAADQSCRRQHCSSNCWSKSVSRGRLVARNRPVRSASSDTSSGLEKPSIARTSLTLWTSSAAGIFLSGTGMVTTQYFAYFCCSIDYVELSIDTKVNKGAIEKNFLPVSRCFT